jgi:hypothetical protein
MSPCHVWNAKVIHSTPVAGSIEITAVTAVSLCDALFRVPVIAPFSIPLLFLFVLGKQHLAMGLRGAFCGELDKRHQGPGGTGARDA